MINAEKEFRSQSDLKSFKGTIEEEDETTYTNKDEWLSAVDDIDWKNLGGASSKSTYSDIITTIDFDFEEISYGVEKK